ncbi:MAG: hypothetical protein ACHP6I_03050 [Rickettsiales bacterium]
MKNNKDNQIKKFANEIADVVVSSPGSNNVFPEPNKVSHICVDAESEGVLLDVLKLKLEGHGGKTVVELADEKADLPGKLNPQLLRARSAICMALNASLVYEEAKKAG